MSKCPEPFHSQDEKINSLLCTSNIYNKFGFDNFCQLKQYTQANILLSFSLPFYLNLCSYCKEKFLFGHTR